MCAALVRRADIVLEGVGAASIDKLAAKVAAMHDAGMLVEASYCTVPTEVALQRMVERGQQTGRFVVPSVVSELYKAVSVVVPQATGRPVDSEPGIVPGEGKIMVAPDLILKVYSAVIFSRTHAESGFPDTPEVQTLFDALTTECAQAKTLGWILEVPFDYPDHPFDTSILSSELGIPDP